MKFSFGSGSLIGVNSAANSTPQQFGALQDVALDFSFSNKELRGRYQMPLTVARGAGKITGKAKTGNISAKMFNDLFFGAGIATGQTKTALGEAAAVPAAGGPYTISVVNSATFLEDLGVVNASTGVPLAKVAAAPATGQYSVSALGVYTFAAADTGVNVLITYTWTTTGGNTITIKNQLMGTAPTFGVTLVESYDGKQITIRLLKCTSSKLALATKLEDFAVPEFDFDVMANDAGIIGYISCEE